MSEAKPYEFEITLADGRKETVSADEVEAVSVKTWVFRNGGKIVRRIPLDELNQDPKPTYAMTAEQIAEWNRVAAETNKKNPQPRRLSPPR